jgi:hypothetical protein
MKRGINGIYHHISQQHLKRSKAIKGIVGKHLTYLADRGMVKIFRRQSSIPPPPLSSSRVAHAKLHAFIIAKIIFWKVQSLAPARDAVFSLAPTPRSAGPIRTTALAW